MLPVEPGDAIDEENSAAGTAFPFGDETAPDDGWAAFSGTSAAAPQLAGTAALIKQVAPDITPAAVKEVLAVTARDVVIGMCSPVPDIHGGLPAGPGDDDATGPGLVDAWSAVIEAYIRSSSGTLATSSMADDLNLQAAAYFRGVADAMGSGAGVMLHDPPAAEMLANIAETANALATAYWSAATS
jgi:subtilisin family serine protease